MLALTTAHVAVTYVGDLYLPRPELTRSKIPWTTRKASPRKHILATNTVSALSGASDPMMIVETVAKAKVRPLE